MPNRRPIRWLKRLTLLVVLAVGAGYGGWRWNSQIDDSPEYQTAAVTRGNLMQVVTANGQLNPVVKVEVGSQISGFIEKLLVDFNSPVKSGQIIAQLDASTYKANLIQAEGNLAHAKSVLELAQINAARAKALQTNTLIARAEYEKAVADLHQAEAAVKINQGVVQRAEVDLARCTIYSPIDGMVISRNVNVGQTVAASLSAPPLFVIANDLTKMQIEARVSEADIGRIHAGQDVKFTVDAYLGEAFRGQIMQVRNAPILDQNVVTYETIIEVTNPELKLKRGMTANVTIIVAHRPSVLKIPNAALRFRPPKNVVVKKIEVADASAKSEKKPTAANPRKINGRLTAPFMCSRRAFSMP